MPGIHLNAHQELAHQASRIYFGQTNAPANLIPKGYTEARIVDTMTKGVRAGATAIELDVTLNGDEDMLATVRERYEEPRPLAEVMELLLAETPEDTELHLELKTSDKVPKNFRPTKNKTLEKKLAEFIRANNLQDRVRLIGFSFMGARWLRENYPDIRTDLGTNHPKSHLVTKEASRRAHRRGIPVESWVCNQPWHYEMKTLRDNLDFVDAVYTNMPGVVQAMLHGVQNKLGARVKNVSEVMPTLKLSDEVCPKGFPKKLFKQWQTEQARYQHLADRLRSHGLSEQSVDEVKAFLMDVLGVPEGFDFALSGEKFAALYKAQDESSRQRTAYVLSRFPMVMIDHFDGVLNALDSDAGWQTVGFLLKGLLNHPDNHRLTLSTKPLGLITSRLAETLDTRSPYWHALEQVTGYFNAALDEAFEPGQQFEKDVEQSYFAAQVLYPFIYHAPLQYNCSEDATDFVENELPEILKDFKAQYPPNAGEEYFRSQEAMLNNVLLYLTDLDRANRPPFEASETVQVINHTPNNHLAPVISPRQQRIMELIFDRRQAADNTLNLGRLPMRSEVEAEKKIPGFDAPLYERRVAVENLASSQTDVSRYFAALGRAKSIFWKTPGIEKLACKVSSKTALKRGIENAQQQIEALLDKRGWSERGGLKHSAFWQAYHLPTRLARLIPEEQAGELLTFVNEKYLPLLVRLPETQWPEYYRQVRGFAARGNGTLPENISRLNELFFPGAEAPDEVHYETTKASPEKSTAISQELAIRKSVIDAQRQGEEVPVALLRDAALKTAAQEDNDLPERFDFSALSGISVGHDNIHEHPDLIELFTR